MPLTPEQLAAFSGTTPPPQQQQSQPTSLSGLLGKVAGFLGVQKFGQGIASAARISTGQDNQERNENDRALQQNAQLISLLHNPKTTPAQKQHILSFMKLISSGEDTLPTEAQIDPGTGLSNKQVIGSALSTAALAAGGGVGADAAADAVTGGIAKGAVGGAVAGAETGAAVGAGSALQNNGSPVDVIKGAVKTGAFGAAGGGLLGGAVGGISDIVAGAGNTIRRVLSPASNLDADAQTAIDSFSTKLSPEEQAVAAQQGRGAVQGASAKMVYKPSTNDLKVAETLKPLVQSGDVVAPVKPEDYLNNITAVQGELEKSTSQLRAGIEDSQGSWKPKELMTKVFKTPVPASIKPTDAPIANLQNATLGLVEDAQKTNVGLLDLRQNFDQMVRKEYPNLYSQDMTPVRQYIQNLRNSINEFTADQLPDGKLPDGTSFRDELRRQSNLITARESMGAKIAQEVPENSTTLSRWVKANPEKARLLRRVAVGALGIYAAGRAINKAITGQ